MRIQLIRKEPDSGFNMTPMIDVVFLLITFFVLAYRYVAPEDFEAILPDKIASAHSADQRPDSRISITVIPKDGKTCYAAGADILPVDDPDLLQKMIISAIDSRLAGQTNKTVCLRCDKQITFKDIRPVLEAISKSSAQNIEWAVVKDQE